MSCLVENPKDRVSRDETQIRTVWYYPVVIHPKDADGMANSEDPSQIRMV